MMSHFDFDAKPMNSHAQLQFAMELLQRCADIIGGRVPSLTEEVRTFLAGAGIRQVQSPGPGPQGRPAPVETIVSGYNLDTECMCRASVPLRDCEHRKSCMPHILGSNWRKELQLIDEGKSVFPSDFVRCPGCDPKYECNARKTTAIVRGIKEAAMDQSGESPAASCRPVVQWFARRMESRLRANDGKSSWLDEKSGWLMGRLLEEIDELSTAIAHRSSDVIEEAADVANFAMMLADIYGAEIGDTKDTGHFFNTASSDIWTNPATDEDPFAGLVIPDNLDEIARKVLDDPEFKSELEKRLKPYRTKITWETMLKPIEGSPAAAEPMCRDDLRCLAICGALPEQICPDSSDGPPMCGDFPKCHESPAAIEHTECPSEEELDEMSECSVCHGTKRVLSFDTSSTFEYWKPCDCTKENPDAHPGEESETSDSGSPVGTEIPAGGASTVQDVDDALFRRYSLGSGGASEVSEAQAQRAIEWYNYLIKVARELECPTGNVLSEVRRLREANERLTKETEEWAKYGKIADDAQLTAALTKIAAAEAREAKMREALDALAEVSPNYGTGRDRAAWNLVRAAQANSGEEGGDDE